MTGLISEDKIAALYQTIYNAGVQSSAIPVILRVIGDKTMYAVIKTGGKQYRVAVGDVLRVESIKAEPGATVELDNVLMVADGAEIKAGSDVADGTTVSATVRDHGRGDKLRVYKFHRRKNYRLTQGHRQNYTELEITAIGGKGA